MDIFFFSQEAEITGQVPVEISQALAPGEELPPIRRRVGTAYAINERILNDEEEDDQADENAAQVCEEFLYPFFCGMSISMLWD